MNRNIVLGIAIVVIAALAGGAWVVTRPGGDRQVTEFSAPGSVAAQEASADLPEIVDMSIGNPDADVTVIEYASFTCPHCRNFHAQVFHQLRANYIDTGKIHFIYREVYFDKFGLWAGLVARCGGPQKYFGVANLIYEQQSVWLASRNDAGIAADLRKLALVAGIDPDQLETCLSDEDMAQALVAEFQRNATADDVNSTPTFIINGEKFLNMNFDEFSAVLDEVLGG